LAFAVYQSPCPLQGHRVSLSSREMYVSLC